MAVSQSKKKVQMGYILMGIPESCEKCHLFTGYNCMIPGEHGHLQGKKPPRCPIKKLPDKKESGKWEEDMKNHGWNDCIDMILGQQNHVMEDL